MSEWDDAWADLPVGTYEHAQAHDSAWALADIAAKRAMLDAHKIQHRCVGPTIEGAYELSDDVPCLVLRQLAAAESVHRLMVPGMADLKGTGR
jgi:hypothetical protein